MATRTIKRAAGKSSLSVAAVRTAAKKATVILRDGRSSSASKPAVSGALTKRGAGRRKGK